MAQRFEVLTEGDAGCFAEMVPEKWGDNTVRPSMCGMYGELSSYYHELVEGGFVVDKKPCYELRRDEAVREVLGGPMLDMDLRSGQMTTVRYFSDMNYESEPFKEGSNPIRVSLDIYLERWRKLGARVGRRVGGEIVWEDGTRDAIKEV